VWCLLSNRRRFAGDRPEYSVPQVQRALHGLRNQIPTGEDSRSTWAVLVAHLWRAVVVQLIVQRSGIE
jgi:hypothetical protein